MVCAPIAVFALILVPAAWGNDVGHPPIHAEEMGSPADGMFRNSPDLAGVEEAYLPPLFESSHAANLLNLRSGELVCTWFSGALEGASDVCIMFARLPKAGHRWDMVRLVDHQPGQSYQNPVPYEAKDGTLWIFHTCQGAGQGQANARVLVTKSFDHGQTWSRPAVLFDTPGVFVRQPLMVMPDGHWMLPSYVTPGPRIVAGATTDF
jgi:predicted neuraminidase